MRTGFVSKIGPYRVERISGVIRTRSAIDQSRPPVGVLHTTEGSWDSAISVYRSKLATPTFQVGPRRIGQLIPLGEMAAALKNPAGGVETNRWARVQIELVGFSRQSRWTPDAGSLDALAHLIAWLEEACDIPLTRPWSGHDLGPLPWATPSYPRRRAGKWGKTSGWFGHVEVPENDHWDPGELDWPAVIRAARDLATPAKARTLQLTTPFMEGEDVLAAQKLLANNRRFGHFAPGSFDGIYGLTTAQATWRAKWWLGYPDEGLSTVYGPNLAAILEGRQKLPGAYAARRRTRIARNLFRTPVLDANRDVH